MLAAPPVAVEALPAHRIALRAALCAVTGSVAAGAVALPLVLLSNQYERGFLMLLALGSGAAMAAFFVVAVEVARRLPAGGRLAAITALGGVSPIFVMCALIWAFYLVKGYGTEAAWQKILEFLGDVLTHPGQSSPAAAAVLIPFTIAGAAHALGLPGRLGRATSLSMRVALATVMGAVALGIASFAYSPPDRVRVLFWGFLFVPPAMEVAIALALRGEARLLTWWAQRREAE